MVALCVLQVYRSLLHQDLAEAPSSQTLESYFASCSLNKVQLRSSDSAVVGPIPLPCNGTTSWGSTWYSDRCGENEIQGWQQAADAYATTVLGVNLTAYKHRIYALPWGLSCPWIGLADVGCERYSWGSCRAWVKAGSSGFGQLVAMHELGHNGGLRHSGGLDGGEYSDYTAAMGGCCTVRCHAAPQGWALGWYELMAGGNLNKTNWQPGQYLQYRSVKADQGLELGRH